MSKTLFYAVFGIAFCDFNKILTFANFHGDQICGHLVPDKGNIKLFQEVVLSFCVHGSKPSAMKKHYPNMKF